MGNGRDHGALAGDVDAVRSTASTGASLVGRPVAKVVALLRHVDEGGIR
jgi:hypothetical protein